MFENCNADSSKCDHKWTSKFLPLWLSSWSWWAVQKPIQPRLLEELCWLLFSRLYKWWWDCLASITAGGNLEHSPMLCPCILCYIITLFQLYVDDSHFQLGFHSLTHVHFITEHKEIKHFSFIREYKLFWYTHVPVVQLFGGIPITLGGNAFKGLEQMSWLNGMLGMTEKCVRCGKWQWILTVLVLRFTFAAPRFSALFWLLTAL